MMKRFAAAMIAVFYLSGCSMTWIEHLQEAGTTKKELRHAQQAATDPKTVGFGIDLSWQNVLSGVAVAAIAVMTFI